MELAKPLSLYPFETIIPPVNDETFNLYYSIDRELYTRLIHNLARDPVDSMHVMALWLWLEKKWKNTNLINEILSLPLEVLNVLADESMICLRCIESNTCELDQTEITLIPEVVNRGPLLNLRYFHENRVEVSTGVTKFITTVCTRAFKDIVQNHMRQQMMSNNSSTVMSGGRYESGVSSNADQEMMMRNSMTIINNNTYNNKMINSGDDVHYYNPSAVGGVVNVPVMYLPNNYHGMVRPPFAPVVPAPEGRAAMSVHEDLPLEAYGDLLPSSFVQMMLADDLSEVFGKNLTVNNNWEGENSAVKGDGGDEEEVAPDDRTIFLTFSKGYPTTKDEVREFFTRKFGDFIEDLIMQEVEAGEQPLYARMVCRSLSVIPSIVGPNKAKYNINGKHVWARKYVKKQNSRV